MNFVHFSFAGKLIILSVCIYSGTIIWL